MLLEIFVVPTKNMALNFLNCTHFSSRALASPCIYHFNQHHCVEIISLSLSRAANYFGGTAAWRLPNASVTFACLFRDSSGNRFPHHKIRGYKKDPPTYKLHPTPAPVKQKVHGPPRDMTVGCEVQLFWYSRYRIYGPQWDQKKIYHIADKTIYPIDLLTEDHLTQEWVLTIVNDLTIYPMTI